MTVGEGVCVLLGNGGLGAITVVSERVTVGSTIGVVWETVSGKSRRPASLFGIRTTDGIHGPLMQTKTAPGTGVGVCGEEDGRREGRGRKRNENTAATQIRRKDRWAASKQRAG